MRVVHIIGRMNVGGPAALVVELQKNLDVDLHVFVGDVDAGEADYLHLRAPDADVTRIPGLGRAVRPTDDIRALGGLIGRLRKLQPDIVHTHTAKAGALGRMAAVVSGVGVRIHTFHGHLLHGYFSPMATRAVVNAERALALTTDRIIAVGEHVRDDLLAARIGTPDQYLVIPPGVSLPHAPPDRAQARAALGLPDQGSVVAYVARLTQIKRPDRMIDVARSLPDVTFVIAGDGPLQAAVRDLAPPNVRFLGWRADIENVYASADAILLTSDNEGMPVTLIEAALCGVPAVAPNVGSVSEVVLDGRTGTVVDAEVPRLTDAVRSILSDDARRQTMGQAAKVWAQDAFSTTKMAQSHMALYESLVTAPPPRGLRRSSILKRGFRPARSSDRR